MEIRWIRRVVFVAVVAVGLASGLLSGQQDDRSRLLMNVEQLAGILGDPDLVLLHVGDSAEYSAEHIPGAVHINLEDISTPHPVDMSRGLMLELPEPSVLKASLERFGISDDSRIVVYFGNDWVTPSTRVVLTLDHAGLGAWTSLLDGGMGAWKAAGHPVTAEPTPERSGHLSAIRTRDVVVTMDEVLAGLGRPGTSIVDARAPRFYEGRYESQSERPGHIAGAKSIPFTEVMDPTLRLKSTADLKALFRAAGVDESETIIAYCHIGQQATAVVFAARTLGYDVKLYDGSYTEWGRPSDRPIEKVGK